MQTVTNSFTNRAAKSVRRLSAQLLMSFGKSYSSSIAFFKLDTSLLDGPDVLAPADSNVIQQWDKYSYTDYSNRIISFDWSRQDNLPSSVSLAMADLVLDNHDGFFTPGSGSAIDGLVLPRRPVRLLAGFGGEVISVFVGLTEKMPTLDQKAGTATFHCIDFLDSLFNRPLNQTVMMLDVRTDQALDALFQSVGLSPGQYVLDHGFNQIPIVYFESTTKLGDAIKKLMDAESGRLYMDELGIIRFKNRVNISNTSVYTFNGSNTIGKTNSDQAAIINVVEINVAPRQVQDKQPLWQLSDIKRIEVGASLPVWADLADPATSMDTPVIGETPNTSYFVFSQGTSTTDPAVTSGVVISSPTLFGKSYLVTVTNNNSFPIYIIKAEFWGTPAKVVNGVLVRVQDDASVAKYDEQPFSIDSEFVQSADAARSLALSILHQYANYGSTVNLDVKGTPALQLADAVTVNVGATNGLYNITKIDAGMTSDPKFLQTLRATQITQMNFFVLDTSLLDGPDVLAP